MPRRVPKEISTIVTDSPFEAAVSLALAKISTAEATRDAYRRDHDLWKAFCLERNIDQATPAEGAAIAWFEWLGRRGDAPKTRLRRMSSLSSIYRRLSSRKVAVETWNPFSDEDGPELKSVAAIKPTPIALPNVVRHVLSTCDSSPLGIRDAAIVRVLWSTGMRRVSLLSMTIERLQSDRAGYIATVVKKGGDTQRTLITKTALESFERWLTILRSGFKRGPVWRELDGTPLTSRDLNRALAERAPRGEQFSPHMLRVAFLTFNRAGIEAKQDAAGHADPETTRGYDRASWRGREAFEQMPEIEEVDA